MREERLIVKPFEDFRLLEYHAFQEMNHHARAELTGSIPYVKKRGVYQGCKTQAMGTGYCTFRGSRVADFYGLIESTILEFLIEGQRIKPVFGIYHAL